MATGTNIKKDVMHRNSRSVVGVPRRTQLAVNVRLEGAGIAVLHLGNGNVRPPTVLDLFIVET